MNGEYLNRVTEDIFRRSDCNIQIEKIKESKHEFNYELDKRNDVLLGIVVKTLDFKEIELINGSLLLSKITPDHFVKNKDDDSYISHFFHQPLYLCCGRYILFKISCPVEYELIFTSISDEYFKKILSNPCDIKALDFHLFRYSGGIFGPVYDIADKAYILTNDKYVKQLNYWVSINSKKNSITT